MPHLTKTLAIIACFSMTLSGCGDASPPPADTDTSASLNPLDRVQEPGASASSSEPQPAPDSGAARRNTKPHPTPPAGSPNPLENPAPQTKAATVFREHKIQDPGMNNQTALTILAPEGWTVEGGITRPAPQFYSTPILLDVKFKAKDGRQARQFPSLIFEFNNQQPAKQFSPTLNGNMSMALPESPGSWLMEMARLEPDPTVKGLRLVSDEPLAEPTEQLRKKHAALYQIVEQGKPMAAQTGVDMEFDTQVSKVVLQYAQDGHQVEESVVIAWQYLIHTYQGQVTHGMWSIDQMMSLRGPVGTDYQNDPELLAITQSARPDPKWMAEMNRYWAELARIRQKGAAQRRQQSFDAHQKRMKTLNETTAIITQGWKRRSAIRDRIHERTIDNIHEVTPYQTPSGEVVKLPSFYDQVYTDGQGRYVLHNDALYDPNTDSSVNQVNWQRVEPPSATGGQ